MEKVKLALFVFTNLPLLYVFFSSSLMYNFSFANALFVRYSCEAVILEKDCLGNSIEKFNPLSTRYFFPNSRYWLSIFRFCTKLVLFYGAHCMSKSILGLKRTIPDHNRCHSHQKR